jgi:hypothetical protein
LSTVEQLSYDELAAHVVAFTVQLAEARVAALESEVAGLGWTSRRTRRRRCRRTRGGEGEAKGGDVAADAV